MRRDAIIKKMVKDLPFCVGEYVAPYNADNRQKYGDTVVILGICDDYTKFGKKEEWPSSDVPMIIQAYSEKAQTNFFCTPGFLKVLSKDAKVTQ